MTIKNWQPPSKAEIQKMIDDHQLSIKKAAHMARISDRTFKQWLDPDDIKMPSQAAWSIFQYELRAMRMGYKNIDHLFNSIEIQYESIN